MIQQRTPQTLGTGGQEKMAEYIDTSINPADYIEVWEAEDIEHGKQLVMAVDDLKYLPPADVRPVVRSHWKKNDNGTYSCERCHSLIPEEQRHYANWCLYCAADMRGGDAE